MSDTTKGAVGAETKTNRFHDRPFEAFAPGDRARRKQIINLPMDVILAVFREKLEYHTSSSDPDATTQNAGCELEKAMGIYPNLDGRANSAETKTAGQVAREGFYSTHHEFRLGRVYGASAEDWERAAASAIKHACEPWKHYSGSPPRDGSPLSGVFVAGMVYAERLLAKLLDVTHYEGGDGSEDFDRDATQTLRNILAGAGLWDADENRPTIPAPTPPVPDSLRALSEAASEDWDTNDATPYILGPPIDGEIDRFEVIARGPHGHAKVGDSIRKWRANRMFAVAAVNFVRALLSTYPAEQIVGSGPIAWLLEKPDGETHPTECRPRDDWKDGTVTPLYAAAHSAPDFASSRAEGMEPAPDSTRTEGEGAEGRQPDELTESEVAGRAKKLLTDHGWEPGQNLHVHAVVGLMTKLGMDVLRTPPEDRCTHPACGCDADSVCGSALAARPAAPEAQGPCSNDTDGEQANALRNCAEAVAFFDKVKASSSAEQAAVGTDHWNWIEAACRRAAKAAPPASSGQGGR